MVNRYGERFYNEAGPYAYVKRAFDFWDHVPSEYRNQPAYFIADANYTERYTFLGFSATDKLPDWVNRPTRCATWQRCGASTKTGWRRRSPSSTRWRARA